METILVTGGSGLVGKAIQSISNNHAFRFVFLSSSDCDLTIEQQVDELFVKVKPDYVIHLAAYVGGLYKNMNQPVHMIEKNVKMNLHVVAACHRYQVKKLIACLSTCIFPDQTTYPINETMLHHGPPHDSNASYAYAKRLLDIQCQAYRNQYQSPFVCVIPTNIYGPHDQFSLEDGHVIPALIHQCYLAKRDGKPFVVRGTGKPLRQFILSTDLATVIMNVLLHESTPERIIVSGREEVSIRYVAECIAQAFNYQEELVFDSTYSDGQYKKTADATLLEHMGPCNWTPLEQGITDTVQWFIDHVNDIRK